MAKTTTQPKTFPKKPAFLPAAAKPGAAAAKPGAVAAKTGGAAALPDAALFDDDDDAPPPSPPRGLAAWLPTGPRRWIVLTGGIIGLIVLVTSAVVMAASRFKGPPPAAYISGAADIIDGATISIAGQQFHLEDIDAPPASLVCLQDAWTYKCGDEARRGLRAAIGQGPVECTQPYRDEDGHFTALCRNDAGLDIASIQVENGWAVNDIKRSSRYIAEEMRARTNASGLWRDNFAYPEFWHSQTSGGR